MKKISLVILFFVSIMTSCSYGATLYIVANTDLYSDYKNFLINLQNNLQNNKKYFFEVELLGEYDAAPKFSTGDYYVFLFGWEGGKSRSTIFFRPDGWFNKYAPLAGEYKRKDGLDMLHNPCLLIFIPLDDKAAYKIDIDGEQYVKFFAEKIKTNTKGYPPRNDGKKNNVELGRLSEKGIKKLSSDETNILKQVENLIMEWVERQSKLLKEKKEESKEEKKSEQKIIKPETKKITALEILQSFVRSMKNFMNRNDKDFIKNELLKHAYSWMMDSEVDSWINETENFENVKYQFTEIKKEYLDDAVVNAAQQILKSKEYGRVDAVIHLLDFMKNLGLETDQSKLAWLFDENADWMKNEQNYKFEDIKKLQSKTFKSFLLSIQKESFNEKTEEKHLKKEEKSSQEKGFFVDRFASALQSIR